MNASTPLERILRHDRAIVLTILVGTAGAAWWYMLYEAQKMHRTGVCECLGLAMSGPDIQPWSAASILPLFLMWAEMMVAMMIPSAAPVILTFAKVNRERRLRQQPFVGTGLFMAGYLGVWAGFSVVAALAQWALHGAALMSEGMESTSPVVGGVLLIFAGIFQFSPWKRACLEHCRSPLGFLLTEWRDGRGGAVMMGLRHGAYCTGCCWLLMIVLFVTGVMNLVWVAIITLLVLVEKLAPRAWKVGMATGLALTLWGLATLIS